MTFVIEGRRLDNIGQVSPGMLRQLPACGDGWCVRRTTAPVEGGPHDGKYVVLAYKPVGPGARTGKPRRHELAYHRGYRLRKDAKARAWALWRKHSSTRNAAHPSVAA